MKCKMLVLVTVIVVAGFLSMKTPAAHAGWLRWPWLQLVDCESGDGDGKPPYRASWHVNGYFDGGLQYLPSTWRQARRLVPAARHIGFAYQASPRVQVEVSKRWLRVTSWLQWPRCSRMLGLR